MIDINVITKDTDISNLQMDALELDLVINGIPYTVYRINGYIHRIGGKYCNNDLWACPFNEAPSYENLIEFDGSAPTWGFDIKESNSIRTRWDETECTSGYLGIITRNEKPFYEVYAGSLSFLAAKLQVCLIDLREHAIPFHLKNWKDRIIGRKVYYRQQKGIITYICEDEGAVIIKPDGDFLFKSPDYYELQRKIDIEKELRLIT